MYQMDGSIMDSELLWGDGVLKYHDDQIDHTRAILLAMLPDQDKWTALDRMKVKNWM